jgi:hypothetical protein
MIPQTAQPLAALTADRRLHHASDLLSPPLATQVLRDRMRDAKRDSLRVKGVTLREHVPGERCVLRFSVQTRGAVHVWHGVIHSDDRALRDWHTQQRLWSAGLRCIPKPIGVIPERHLYLERPVDGVPLLTAMLTTPSVSRLADAVLRACHATAELPLLPERSWNVGDAIVRGLGDRRPSAPPSIGAQRWRALLEPLAHRRAVGVMHPELRPERLALHVGRIVLPEPESCALGDPAHDPGAIVGALLLRGRSHPRERGAANALASALLRRAARQSPERWDATAVSRWACISVAERGAPLARARSASRSEDELLRALMHAIERDGSIAGLLA